MAPRGVPGGRRYESENRAGLGDPGVAARKFWTHRYARRVTFDAGTCGRPLSTPVVSAAKTLHHCIGRLLSYSRHPLTNANAEALNTKIQTVKEMACGFRSREHYKMAIYLHCDRLDLYPRFEVAPS